MILALLRAVFVAAFILMVSACSSVNDNQEVSNANTDATAISGGQLPPPVTEGEVSVEQALYRRQSKRSFSDRQLSLEEVGQLLWAAQGLSVDGITGPTRTAPSAGATHPLQIYLVAGNVEGLQSGFYRYDYLNHDLELLTAKDLRAELARAALNQSFIKDAPISVILAADYERTTLVYGERGISYVYMEVGHVTQNILLQGEALGLGAVAVGAFSDGEVKALLNLDEEPLMIIPLGEPI